MRIGYGTQNGASTATETTDYTRTVGFLVFEKRERSKKIEVPIVDDSVEDDGETVVVRISEQHGRAEIVDDRGSGTIRDNVDALLTASWWEMPREHRAQAFTFRLDFSQDIASGAAAVKSAQCQRSLKTDRFSTPVGDSAGTRCSFGLD